MIDYDTSRYPAGTRGWNELLEAIEHAAPEDESDWIEFKANLDLTKRANRPVLAKAIIAFANRDVSRASKHLQGRALVVIGLEPGNVVGTQPMDPADIHDSIAPYLAEPAPEWDVTYCTYKHVQVLIVTVDAPKDGDPIRCFAKAGDGVQDGAVYVRNVGQSAPARSSDLRSLSARMLARPQAGVEVDVLADAGNGVPSFELPADWLDRWIDTERGRLMAPLETLRRVSRRPYGNNGQPALGLERIHDLFAAQGFLQERHEEDRGSQDYEDEVEAYLAECRRCLPSAVTTLSNALAEIVVFKVRNLTDDNYHQLEVEIHVEGDVAAFEERVDFPGLSTFTPQSPRIWGPWTESRMPYQGIVNHADLLASSAAAGQFVRATGPKIVNGGSARITFQTMDLRPKAEADLDNDLVLIAGPGVNREITCRWSATATNVRGRAAGTLALPLESAAVNLRPYLTHGSIKSSDGPP